MTPQRSFVRYLPAAAALLATGAIYVLVSDQFPLGPRGLLPGVLFTLAVVLLGAVRANQVHLGRTVGFALLGVVTAAEAVTTTMLVVNLLAAPGPMDAMPYETALTLLRNAALVWIVNILTFSFWYWEIDDGGPSKRHFEGYQCRDFVFPQKALASSSESPWLPQYVDYLFLAFNTSTAFSPTDIAVLSVRAKLLMMIQSLISLTVLAIIAARAINTL